MTHAVPRGVYKKPHPCHIKVTNTETGGGVCLGIGGYQTQSHAHFLMLQI